MAVDTWSPPLAMSQFFTRCLSAACQLLRLWVTPLVKRDNALTSRREHWEGLAALRRSMLVLVCSIFVISTAASAEIEPDAVVVARSVACYQIETLNNYDELFVSGERRAAQRLMFAALAQGDCVILAGRTRAYRQMYRAYRTCVRPSNHSNCIWIDNGVLRSW